jgi:uncharacterized protein (DUF4415 family)
MTSKRKLRIPSDAEDDAITRAAEGDPNNPPLADDQLKRLQPARDVLPSIVGDKAAEDLLRRRGRPATPVEEHKVRTKIRLDPDLLDAFNETGAGWQSRINDGLRDWAQSHGMFRGRKRKRDERTY